MSKETKIYEMRVERITWENCSAYFRRADGAQICRNGFPTHPACQGGPRGVPFCCRDEWCGRTFDENGGKPRLG